MPEDTLPKQFTASFSVDSPEAHDSAWQQFREEAFATPARAADNALEIARIAIDRRISAKPFTGRDRSG